MKEAKLNTPVLFLIFNRPKETREVFNEIRKAKPRKLYISADGPRKDKEGEKDVCAETRNILEQIDWECDVHTRFLDSNMGCKMGVSSAINWAFKNEQYLIILEDDCKPSQAFFLYAQELLEKYKNTPQIAMISGDNYNEEYNFENKDYTFSKIGHHIWGWATWKRAWQLYDIDMDYYDNILSEKKYKDNLGNKKINNFFKERLTMFYNSDEKLKTWDYQWFFSIIYQDGLTIVPRKNLVSNIGVEGAHASKQHSFHHRKVDHNFKIKNHPEVVQQDLNYDLYHFENHWKKMLNTSIVKKLKRKIKKIIT